MMKEICVWAQKYWTPMPVIQDAMSQCFEKRTTSTVWRWISKAEEAPMRFAAATTTHHHHHHDVDAVIFSLASVC